MRRVRRVARGFAIADFLAGTAIFAGALVGFAALTQSKFEVLHLASSQQLAQARLEAELDAIRRAKTFSVKSTKDPDVADGFVELSSQEVSIKGIGPATIQTSARPLLTLNAKDERYREPEIHEVRVRITWLDGALSLSTIREVTP